MEREHPDKFNRTVLPGKGDDGNLSFTCFYRNYKDRVRQFVSRYCFDSYSEDDLVQEVFLKLWRKREQLKDVNNPDTWIVAFTRNVIMDQLRKQRKEQIGWQEYCKTFRSIYSRGDEPYGNKWFEKQYAEMVQGLPHRQRQTFILLREMKYKRKEAARMLGISENTVKFNMKKALEKLADQLKLHSTGV